MASITSPEKNNPESHIAFFDLDGTLTKAISGKELARNAFKKGLLSRDRLVRSLYLLLLFKLNLRDPQKIIDEMFSWISGIPELTMNNLCTEVFHHVLLPSLYEQARVEILSHKKSKARVVILSSSLSPICLEVTKSLALDDFLCSGIEVNNGYLTGRPVGQLCFGEEKAVRLKKYCEINNSNIYDAWYYGDSISDFPALRIVGNPVCVNPDKKLKKEALLRGWKILHWKN